MCRSCDHGGRRCSRANPTRIWRTTVTERLARNRRVHATASGKRRERLAAKIARDEHRLSQIHTAIDIYGEHVTDAIGPNLPSGDIDLPSPGASDNITSVSQPESNREPDGITPITHTAAQNNSSLAPCAYDPLLKVRVDPQAFAEDPTRVLRVMQFSSPAGTPIDPGTSTFCRELCHEAHTIEREQVRREWAKWARQSAAHSQGLRALAETEWDRKIPGLAAANTPTTRGYLDRANNILARETRDRARINPQVVYGAVLAGNMNNEDAHAFIAHTIEGKHLQRRTYALSRATNLPATAAAVRHAALDEHSTLRERLVVAESIHGPAAVAASRAACERAGVLDRPEPDLITGRDVLAVTDRKTGPWIGELLHAARHAQADGQFRTKAASLQWLAARLRPVQLTG